MGRCSKLDWDDKTANEFFEDTVSVSEKLKKDVSTLWRYSKGLPKQWKHSICWGDAKQHRFALAEAFTKTKGRQLNHKKLSEQLAAWLQDKGVKVTATDTELAAYRLRAMMRHLADIRNATPNTIITVGGLPVAYPSGIPLQYGTQEAPCTPPDAV